MATTDHSDATLVAEALAGNRASFGQIVTRYQTLICSLAYSDTGSLGLSEDLAQDTFVIAWKKLPSLQEPQKLRSWLCGIARNLTCDALRRQGREPSHHAEPIEDLAESPSPTPWPVNEAISREEQEILWQAIERIPETYREPLVLFYRNHQSIEAVALGLELSEDAVKQRLSRGRKLLQEQIVAFVEGALERSNPGKIFTMSVLAALPAMTISAKAATVGAAAAKGSATAKAAGAIGVAGAIFGPLLIFFGNYVGYRMSLDSAHSEEERIRIRAIYREILAMALTFFVAFVALILWATRHRQDHMPTFGLLLLGLIVIYLLTLFGFVAGTLRKRRRYLTSLLQAGKVERMPRAAWEYRSRTTFLGLPLVHICIGDRFAVVKKPVTAWIAMGDCAVGALAAFGGMAVAPVSVGGLAIGLLPFGGLAIGILALGGFALGAWSYGGCALGWQANGGCAIAWNAAAGGLAVAHGLAIGGFAQAAQANTETARHIINAMPFFRFAEAFMHYSLWLNLLWIVPMIIQWRVIAHRRQSSSADPTTR